MLVSHARPVILAAAHAVVSIRFLPDRNLILNAAALGDLASFESALRAAIAEEHRLRGRSLLHVPPWITIPTMARAWQEAAFTAAAGGAGERGLAAHLPAYAGTLRAAAEEAKRDLATHRSAWDRLVATARNTNAERDHYRAAHPSPEELRWSILMRQVGKAAVILCELGAIGGVVGAHFGVGTGLGWLLLPFMSRLQVLCITGGTLVASVYVSQFLVRKAREPGSRLRALAVPLAITSLIALAVMLAAVRYAGSIELAALTSGTAQAGTLGVVGLAVFIGLVGAVVAGALGCSIEDARAELRTLSANEAQYATALANLDEDIANEATAIEVCEANLQQPAVAATHFEQAFIGARECLREFAIEAEQRVSRARVVFIQLARLSPADREQVDLLLREIVREGEQASSNSELAS